MFNINYTNILLGLPFLRLLQLSSISHLHLYPIYKYQPMPRLILLPLPSTPSFLLCQNSGFQPFYILRLTVIPVHLIVRRTRKSKQVKHTHCITVVTVLFFAKFRSSLFSALRKTMLQCVLHRFFGGWEGETLLPIDSLKIQLYLLY